MENQNKKKSGWSFGLSLAVLVILAIFTIGLGTAMVLNNLRGPFMQTINVNENLAGSAVNQEPTIEQLKQTDTDKDGLNDFEELYIYKTSPYLADSDSDGYSDKEEIDSGYDPNCPYGQDCKNAKPVTPETNTNTNSNTNAAIIPTSTSLNENDLNVLKNLSAAEIRQLILESGQLTQEQLDQIDDATLIQFYQEALKENTGQ